MFKISEKPKAQPQSVKQHSMKLVQVCFKKSEFESKKSIKSFYKTNYMNLGLLIDFDDENNWSQDDEFFVFQVAEVFNNPYHIVRIPSQIKGVEFSYHYRTYNMFKKEDESAFILKAKSLLE